MHANKVPVLIQWRGDGPHDTGSAPDDAEEGRKLRKSVSETRAQEFFHRVRSLPEHVRRDEQVTAVQRMLESSYRHSVTFQNCVFAVRLSTPHETAATSKSYEQILTLLLSFYVFVSAQYHH